jgi:hypothetical protein
VSEADPDKDGQFAQALRSLLVRYGATDDQTLERATQTAVSALLEALEETEDGHSLSALDVVRIRVNKFAATRVPAAVFRDPAQLAQFRADTRALALGWLGADSRKSSR